MESGKGRGFDASHGASAGGFCRRVSSRRFSNLVTIQIMAAVAHTAVSRTWSGDMAFSVAAATWKQPMPQSVTIATNTNALNGGLRFRIPRSYRTRRFPGNRFSFPAARHGG